MRTNKLFSRKLWFSLKLFTADGNCFDTFLFQTSAESAFLRHQKSCGLREVVYGTDFPFFESTDKLFHASGGDEVQRNVKKFSNISE